MHCFRLAWMQCFGPMLASGFLCILGEIKEALPEPDHAALMLLSMPPTPCRRPHRQRQNILHKHCRQPDVLLL
jgi:hypothetical protein